MGMDGDDYFGRRYICTYLHLGAAFRVGFLEREISQSEGCRVSLASGFCAPVSVERALNVEWTLGRKGQRDTRFAFMMRMRKDVCVFLSLFTIKIIGMGHPLNLEMALENIFNDAVSI